MEQLMFNLDGTIQTESKGIKKLYWGYQTAEKTVTRKTIIAVPDAGNKLTVCANCGAVFRYLGQKFCGGCGSELIIMSQEKYQEWLKKIKETGDDTRS